MYFFVHIFFILSKLYSNKSFYITKVKEHDKYKVKFMYNTDYKLIIQHPIKKFNKYKLMVLTITVFKKYSVQAYFFNKKI